MSDEEKEYQEISEKVGPLPRGICPDCLKSPKMTYISADGSMIVSFCAHHLCGGIMVLHDDPAKRRWNLFTPMSADDFAELLLDQLQIAGALEEAVFKNIDRTQWKS